MVSRLLFTPADAAPMAMPSATLCTSRPRNDAVNMGGGVDGDGSAGTPWAWMSLAPWACAWPPPWPSPTESIKNMTRNPRMSAGPM